MNGRSMQGYHLPSLITPFTWEKERKAIFTETPRGDLSTCAYPP